MISTEILFKWLSGFLFNGNNQVISFQLRWKPFDLPTVGGVDFVKVRKFNNKNIKSVGDY